MSTGNWLNNDGLWLQYGVTKAVPEMAGDYVMWGPYREIEALISLGALSIGNPSNQANVAALPSSFQGTVASQTAAANTGIISYTTFFPLQATAPVTTANTSGVLTITNPQLWISQIDLECFVAAAAGGGSGTGLTGVGLVTALPVNGTNPSAWAQITPNAGKQLLGTTTNDAMVLGTHFMWLADGTLVGSSTGTTKTAGTWLGNVPLTTLSETFLPGGLPNNAYLSAIVSGGQFTQSGAGGLVSLRVQYRQMYTINDATQI